MRYRTLGRTGLRVSEIGFGTIPILSGNVPVLPAYFSPDTEQAVRILTLAYEMGCNFYDTAVPEEYGDAEQKLGAFARKIGRENIIISDKARAFDGNEMFLAVRRSAAQLGTKPDIFFVHQVDEKNADETFSRYGALDALCDLRRAGMIGYTGIATHYYSVAARAAADSRVDVIQTSGNILERGIMDRIAADDRFRSKGLILNKVYAAGCLIPAFTPAELIGGMLRYPFSCALIGIGTGAQARAAMQEYPPKTFAFDAVMQRLSQRFSPIPCTRCQQCICPHGYEPHILLRQYNYCHLGKRYWAMKKMRMNIAEVAAHCRSCIDMPCMRNCPQHLHIPEQIAKIEALTR